MKRECSSSFELVVTNNIDERVGELVPLVENCQIKEKFTTSFVTEEGLSADIDMEENTEMKSG